MNVSQPSNQAPMPPAEQTAQRPAAEPAQRAAPPPPGPVTRESWEQGYYRADNPTAGPRPKSPPLACILSVVPGLGQIYVGYYGLGFVHAIVAATVFTILVSNPADKLLPFGVIFFIFFMLYNIVDAGRRAALFNLAMAGVPGVELPEQMKMPRPGGTIFGGIGLIAVGVIFLSYTKFGASLEWVEEWWPLAPILFGGWLIARAIQERTSRQ